jgi:hypothetical protein
MTKRLDARREWQDNHKLQDDPRITPFDRLMRRTSLDELPQLHARQRRNRGSALSPARRPYQCASSSPSSPLGASGIVSA